VPGLRPPLVLLALLLAALTGVAAGCSHSTRVASGGTLQIALTEYHVQPQSVSAPAGLLTIDVHNYGRLSHNLVIALAGHPVFSTKPIPPGQTSELFANLSPGKYVMASTLLADQALGAYGTLNVTR
jgi:Cupredoxin-like domain